MRRLLFVVLLIAGALWYLATEAEEETPVDQFVDDFPTEDLSPDGDALGNG